jgi:hypothetical protein
VKHEPVPLADIAERVLTDIVLKRMVAYEHVLGPYRPARPLLRGAINQLRFIAWRMFK